MRKFEHTTSPVDRHNPGELYKELGQWEKDGWELVTVLHIAGSSYELYWKREIKRSWFEIIMGRHDNF